MKYIDFFKEYYLSEPVVVNFFVISGIFLFIFVFRKHFYTLYDPLLFYLFFQGVCFGVVSYLYYRELIDIYYYSNFLLCNLAFSIGFLMIKPFFARKINLKPQKRGLIRILEKKMLYLVFIGFCYNIFDLWITVTSKGEEFFSIYKADVHSYKAIDDVSLKLLEKIFLFPEYIALFFSVHLLFNKHCQDHLLSKKSSYRLLCTFIILIYLVQSFFSGSKTSIFSFLFLIYTIEISKINFNNREIFLLTPLRIIKSFFLNFYLQKLKIKQVIILGVLAGVVTFIIIFSQIVQPLIEVNNVYEVVAFILLSRSDVYILGYINQTIDKLHDVNFLVALLANPLAFLKIISPQDVPLGLGNELYLYYYSNLDTLIGPNARYEVFFLKYAGFGMSILCSGILGFIISYYRNSCFVKLASYNLTGIALYFYFLMPVITSIIDPPLGMAYIVNNFGSMLIWISIIFLL